MRRIEIGVIATEHKLQVRTELRRQYADQSRYNSRVTFVMDSAKQHLARDANYSDVFLVKNMKSSALCAHKSIAWFKSALTKNADFLVKTDDDSLVRIDRLALVLRHVRPQRVYSGHLGYSSFNVSQQRGSCFGYGPRRALKLRRTICSDDEGPYPFAIGPLIIMSRDTALGIDLTPLSNQRCKNEDRIIGYAVSRLNNVTLVPLGSNAVLNSDGATFASHHIRQAREFEKRTWAPLRWLDTFTCSPWLSKFSSLADFSCCQDWTLCHHGAGTKSNI